MTTAMRRVSRALAMAVLCFAAHSTAADAAPKRAVAQTPIAGTSGSLEVRVGNVKSARGHVHVDICKEDEFLKDCPISGEAPAVMGVTIVTIQNLPPGVYAAQVFHDVNDNHKVDRDLFGIPREGVGFSNDPRIRLKAPKFASASFNYDGQPNSISLSLQYFTLH